MASTYSPNLAFELIGTGDQSGTWGNTTNTNLGTLIEQAISGYVTQAITDGADTVITIPNGASGVARNMYIECTGALTAGRNLVVPANKKLYFIYNNTTGGFAVTVKVSGQTGVSVPSGAKLILASNGTDIVNATTYVANGGALGTPSSGTITNLTGTASININGTVGATTPATGAFTAVSASAIATAISATGATTSYRAANIANTGGSIYVGVDNSTGSNFFTSGSSAYDSVVTFDSGTALTVGVFGGAAVGRFSSTGLVLTGDFLSGSGASGITNANNFNVRASVADANVNHVSGTGSGTSYINFGYSGGVIGSITQSGTSAVLYNLTSDYRIKTVNGVFSDSGRIIDGVDVYSAYYTRDGGPDKAMFLAHEVQAYAPMSVTGVKDAVDADGKPVLQQLDHSSLVPVLWAQVRELRQRITALEAK